MFSLLVHRMRIVFRSCNVIQFGDLCCMSFFMLLHCFIFNVSLHSNIYDVVSIVWIYFVCALPFSISGIAVDDIVSDEIGLLLLLSS